MSEIEIEQMHKNVISRYMKHFKKVNIIFRTNRKDRNESI